jgi:hypothetical protein
MLLVNTLCAATADVSGWIFGAMGNAAAMTAGTPRTIRPSSSGVSGTTQNERPVPPMIKTRAYRR